MLEAYYKYIQTDKGRYEWISYGQAILMVLIISILIYAVLVYIEIGTVPYNLVKSIGTESC